MNPDNTSQQFRQENRKGNKPANDNVDIVHARNGKMSTVLVAFT